MSVSIVTVGNLGEKENLKTTEILPVIDVFAKKSELRQVLCQINTNFYFPNTHPAIPTLIRYFVRALEKFFGLSLERTTHTLFDYFAALKLEKADVTILHPLRHGRAARKARKNGGVSVGIATIAYPAFDERIYKEECERFGATFVADSAEIFHRRAAIIGSFDYIITLSDFTKATYVENGFPAEKIFLASLDIPLSQVAERKKSDKFKVVYVAYTNPRKGLPYLLDAWESLKLPNAELVLVGKYVGMPEEMIKYCDKIINRNPSIKWVGGTQDPWQYYQDASAFVLPSLSECYGKVTLEAMASGVPVIVSENARAIVEDGKTGFVVPIRDAKAIKEKIEYLYHNREIAEKMGREARKAVENKKSFGEEVFEIYQEILKREGK